MGLGQSLSISFRGSTWALCLLALLLLSFLLNKRSFWDGTAKKAFKRHSIKSAGPYCSFLVTFFTVPLVVHQTCTNLHLMLYYTVSHCKYQHLTLFTMYRTPMTYITMFLCPTSMKWIHVCSKYYGINQNARLRCFPAWDLFEQHDRLNYSQCFFL